MGGGEGEEEEEEGEAAVPAYRDPLTSTRASAWARHPKPGLRTHARKQAGRQAGRHLEKYFIYFNE